MNKYRRAAWAMAAVLVGTVIPGTPAVQTVIAQETTLNTSEALLKEQRLNMWYSQAIESINDEDYENALLCLDGCIASVRKEGNPELYADLFLKRGYCYYMTGKPDDALEALDEALSVDPELQSAVLIKASVYSDTKEYLAAAEALEYYISLSGDEAMYETVAALYEALGESDKAVESYSKFSDSVSADEAESSFNTAVYLMGRSQYEDAIKYFDQCIEAETPPDGAYYNRGLCHMSLGDYESAAADFGASVETGETDADSALYTKATCEMTVLNYEDAIEDFTACAEQEINVKDSKINRGICLMMNAQTDEALEQFNECIEQDFNADEARFYRSYVYMGSKDYESALADLTECISNGYDLPASYLQRAQVNKELGDEEAYKADLEAAQKAQAEADAEAEEPAGEAVTEAVTEDALEIPIKEAPED